MVFSTFLGGFTDDEATGVALDGSANAYITGTTASTDFPTVGTPIQATNAGGSDVFIAKISGLTLPVASFSVPGLNFGDVVAGFSGGPLPVTLTNRGDALLNITAIVASGDYSETDDCGAVPTTLAPGASCTFNVTFTPTGTGTRDGALTITDDAYGSPHAVDLTGNGVSQAVVGLSTGALAFGNQRVGTTSAVQSVTLTNSGTGALDITSIIATTDFNVEATSTCGAIVLAGANCTIDMTFSPTTLGLNSGMLTITDDAAGSPRVVTLSGTGVVGVVLAPASLNFADTLVGEETATQTVTLTNDGNAVVTITTITLASGDFSQTNDCPISPATLAAGGFCTFTVKFRPTAIGSRLGEIVITDDVPTAGSTQSISLTGNGVAPVSSLSTLNLTFADQLVGTTSAAQPFTITNTGTAPLRITKITVGGNFAQTNDCGALPATVAASGGFCTFSVTFAPLSSGKLTGGVSIENDSGNSTHIDSVGTSGTGLAPAVTFNPLNALLSFGDQLVGTMSAAKTATLTNSGNSPLTITSIVSLSPDFTQTNDCPLSPATLAAGAFCTFTVKFTPTAPDIRRAGITITDDAGNVAGHIDTVGLEGNGIAPAVLFTPLAGLDFGNQLVNTPSATQPVTLTNSGTSALTISLIEITGDFTQTNNCPVSPATLAAGASCVFTVTFTPTATDIRRGGIKVTDDASGSPHTVSFQGTGVAPAVTFTPAAGIDFGNQLVNTPSATQPVTLTNSGTSALTITLIEISGDFTQTNNCPVSPATLAASASCTFTVQFTPTATDIRRGGIKVTDDASGSPHTVSFQGTGVGPAVTFTPLAGLDFGIQLVGTTSASQPITLTNSGTSPLTISLIEISGDFTQTNNCPVAPATLAATLSCTFTVTFTPTTTDIRRGGIKVTDDAGGSPHVVGLQGTGTAPEVLLSTPTLSFDSQALGTTSPAQIVTLTNKGSAPLTMTSIEVTGDDFARTTTCGASLAAGASCQISVTFTPIATDIRRGAVKITDNAPGSPHLVSLTGIGAAPVVSFTPTDTVAFGNQPMDVPSTARIVTLTNTGGAPLVITSISISGDFSQTNTCGALPATLAAGASCTFSIVFTPTAADILRGAVTIENNAPGSPHAIFLNGVGAVPRAILSADLDFGLQGVGTTSTSQTATLTNGGDAPLTITSITLTNPEFSQTNTCGTLPVTLAAGAGCTFTVTFSPTTLDVRRGGISIADNAAGTPHILGLTGTGATAFALSTAADTVTIARGVDTATYTINASTTFGFTGDIVLSCSGTESGVCTFSPATIKPGQSSTLTLSGALAFTGNFLIFTVQGLSGAQAASQTLTLLIADYAVAPTAASATVTAGQPATYTLNLASANGFTGTVSLACSGNPVRSTCAILPASVTLDGVNPESATVTINTTARAASPPNPGSKLAPPGRGIFDSLRQQILWLLAFLMLAGILRAGKRRRLRVNALVLAAVLMMALLWAACGGETVNVPPGDVGTPAGTYNVLITATSGSAVHTTTLTLTVN